MSAYELRVWPTSHVISLFLIWAGTGARKHRYIICDHSRPRAAVAKRCRVVG